ncbi:MAG: nuclear transport factor 2 family protein [Actinomycetia bacterium]|nr:nuclear transport factor 2 family protein [Actinomycetes bacterium]MCP4958132.1 nuclear transport factor 2 family protein [Actinomycetes bacterium]
MTSAATTEVTRVTRSVIERYEHELYNARDLTKVPELLADPMYRHDAGGKVTTMSQADCEARIGGFLESFTELTFRTIHLIVDGPLASYTYELTMTTADGTSQVISSIEIFEVRDDKIVAVWNAPYAQGPWR